MTGILFDLDGTLLDTLEDLTDATNYTLTRFGYPSRTCEQVRIALGNGAQTQLRRSLPEGTAESTIAQLLAVYKPYYTAHCQIKTKPYPGIPEALAILKERYPLAIVSPPWAKSPDAPGSLRRIWFSGPWRPLGRIGAFMWETARWTCRRQRTPGRRALRCFGASAAVRRWRLPGGRTCAPARRSWQT